ncbi:MAG: DUF3592 domain-containing protein [Phycisphaerales bacterium]|nr:DUF3592 domain-containing protein [Phycisphaerales bacterium]
MLVVFVVFLGGLGVMLIVVGVREHVLQKRVVSNAVPVDAVILSVEVKSSRSYDSDHRPLRDNSTTSHTPEVRFEYMVDGKRYESDMIYPTVIVTGYASKESATEEVREFVAGSSVRAYVNPELPERAFLRMQTSSNPVWFVVGGVLTFVLLAVLIRFL